MTLYLQDMLSEVEVYSEDLHVKGKTAEGTLVTVVYIRPLYFVLSK